MNLPEGKKISPIFKIKSLTLNKGACFDVQK